MNTPITHSESLQDLMTAVSTTIAKHLKGSIDALKEDRADRHRVANLAQSANDLAIGNKSRIDALDVRMQALIGDGTGENGKLAAMTKSQLQTQLGVEELKGDVKQIKDTVADLKSIGEQSKSAISGGRALMTTLGLLSTFIAVVGGVVAGILWVYKH
ncbi:hypothetical protein ACFQBQ_02370 [Granulicella cerasi]|uniref:Uncharacterized protein n=1 Tax=Granulicella cerasi TaxID=741063 RepID=A0ABW1Z5M5_9BACT|nr:hypothetical protein [Granulicella cerasi]